MSGTGRSRTAPIRDAAAIAFVALVAQMYLAKAVPNACTTPPTWCFGIWRIVAVVHAIALGVTVVAFIASVRWVWNNHPEHTGGDPRD